MQSPQLSYLFLSLLTSSICLFYMTTLKLNKYIKTILCSLAVVNITTILLSIISNVLMILFSQTTFFTCLILNQVTYVIVYENISAVSLISVLRYTMAYNASRFKITSTRYILPAISMAFSVPIFVLVVNGIVTSTSGIYMEMCLGYKVFEKYHILWVFFPKSKLSSKCLIPLLSLKTFCWT